MICKTKQHNELNMEVMILAFENSNIPGQTIEEKTIYIIKNKIPSRIQQTTQGLSYELVDTSVESKWILIQVTIW